MSVAGLLRQMMELTKGAVQLLRGGELSFASANDV
jgi:hypothetical protein